MSLQAAPNDDQLIEFETLAAELARGAGEMLLDCFGQPLQVEFKDQRRTDPVTIADKKVQRYLVDGISSRFPEHGIVGEEGEEGDESAVPDLLWVLDPLDGTKNFMSGLPIYGCSIGLLFRGAPVVGAIFVPWPCEGGGLVIHGHRGGGAHMGEKSVSLAGGREQDWEGLIGVPAYFGKSPRFKKGTRTVGGEPRVTGSITYELALICTGVVRYSLIGAPRLWDVAAGATLVSEAAGLAVVRRRSRKLNILETTWWETLSSFMPAWEYGNTTVQRLRGWSSPMVFGNPEVVRQVTAALSRTRFAAPRLRARRREQ